MSVGDRWWDPNAPVAPAEGDSAMTDEEAAALYQQLAGGGTSGQFVTLPNGHYVLIDPKTGRVIQDFGAKAPAAAGGGATGGQQLGYQQDMAALAEQQRQFDLTQGERKARGDQQMNLDSELGRGQLGVSQGNLAVNQGNLGVSQGRLTLDQQMQAYKQYSDLAALASNPRNFVQTYFMNRGYTPPPDVARYGNTPSNAANIMPYSQFAQQQGMFGGAPQQAAPRPMAPAAPTYANPVVSQTGAQYPQGTQLSPSGTGVYGDSYSGLSGFDRATGKPRLSPTDPDAAGLMAKNPGMYAMTSQEEAMKYLPQKPRMMARGGTLRMTGPHAVIDLMSGKIRAIAGERGPENAYFDGAAIIDEGGDTTDPYSGYMPGYDPTYTDPYAVAPQTYSSTGTTVAPTQQPAPLQNWTQAELQAMIAAANAGNAPVTQPTTGTIYQTQPAPQMPMTQTITPQIQQPPQETDATAATAYYQNFLKTMNQPLPPPPTAEQPTNAYSQFQQQYVQPPPPGTTPGGATPIDLAVGGSGQSALPVGTPTATNPQNASVPGSNAPTFGQPIPSRMPSFLAGEDFQGQSDVLRGLQQGGAVPPFLSRIFGQARGDQKYATNTPQRTDLPPDLPLISRLGWEQLSPSEQQGFLSFASSLGVTPEDYLALVYGSSPQGGAAQAPVFGSPLSWNRQ